MTIGAVIAIAALPAFGGFLLWLTSWMEERVVDPAPGPAVVDPEPAESALGASNPAG
jgi:hypothetical protein